MPFTFAVPAAGPGDEEPEISVPASFVGDAAELLALAAELIDTARAPAGTSRRSWAPRAPSPGPPRTG